MIPRSTYMISVASLILIGGLMWPASAELFTAISDVEYLLETHKKIIDDLDVYIENEEKRLYGLKKHLRHYKSEHERAMEDIPNYLGNPINAFTLIKRLTKDLDNIEEGIKIGTEYIKNITMSQPELQYPTQEDLVGAATALTRLQETYHLDVRDLSAGILNGVSYSAPMSASDCYELGRALYNQGDYRNALAWMTETLRKYGEEDTQLNFDRTDILEYIAFSHYLLGRSSQQALEFLDRVTASDVLQVTTTKWWPEHGIILLFGQSGNPKSALEWTKQLLVEDPQHSRALGNIPHYEKSILEEADKKTRRLRGDTGEDDIEETPQKSTYAFERKQYEKLCRGEMDIPSEIAKRLRCRYLRENHPFLLLAPIKVEQVYIKPDIYIFHQVLSDEEIKHIKDMARPRFKRAVVHDPLTGKLIAAHYRISKSGWLKDEESSLVARVSRRVSDMTGLDMVSAEELQVVNYGIGGHYEPHYDFARRTENAFANFPGNRIATVLFYMSEVAQGGATVFTELGLSVSPVKNAAVFWLNLHPSGEGDLATRHAACPVLRGSKWVCNKWIHQGGQELIKPCSVTYQDEGYMRQIPKPIPKSS